MNIESTQKYMKSPIAKQINKYIAYSTCTHSLCFVLAYGFSYRTTKTHDASFAIEFQCTNGLMLIILLQQTSLLSDFKLFSALPMALEH